MGGVIYLIKVKGSLRSLFTFGNRPWIISDEEFEILAKSLVREPITDNGKDCIGVITNVDISKDEWKGYLFKTDTVSLDISRNTSISIDLI